MVGWLAGCTTIWSALFTVGNFLYGRIGYALALLAVFVVSALVLTRVVNTLWTAQPEHERETVGQAEFKRFSQKGAGGGTRSGSDGSAGTQPSDAVLALPSLPLRVPCLPLAPFARNCRPGRAAFSARISTTLSRGIRARARRDDTELVEAARCGDAGALGELVRRHQRYVFAVALSLVGDPAEAEDLAQEAFIRALRNLDLLADPAKFAPWVRRIVFGVCIDWLRAFRPELYRSSPDLEEGGRAPERHALAARAARAGRALRARLRPRPAPGAPRAADALPPRRVEPREGRPGRSACPSGPSARSSRGPAASSRPCSQPTPGRSSPCHRRTTTSSRSKPSPTPSHPQRRLHARGHRAIERAGTFGVWADVLHEGPVPSGLSLEQFREVRARFHADRDHTETYEAALDYHRRWDDGLASFPEYDEVILWFEHDLFDQLILIRHLDYFAGRDMGGTPLSLVCVGEYPGVDRFIGLGQLDPDQLASLAGTRQQVTAGQLDLGRAAWAAFTAPDPTRLERTRPRGHVGPPFLAGALRRFLEEYPSVRDGLPRTERQILVALLSGPAAPVDLFHAMPPARGAPVHGRCDLLGPGEGLAAGPHRSSHAR